MGDKSTMIDYVKRRLSPKSKKPPLIVNENTRNLLKSLEASERGERPKPRKR